MFIALFRYNSSQHGSVWIWPLVKTISQSASVLKDPLSQSLLLSDGTKCISHTNVIPQLEATGFNLHTLFPHRSLSRVYASNTLPHPLRNLIMDEDLDFLCLTETWL